MRKLVYIAFLFTLALLTTSCDPSSPADNNNNPDSNGNLSKAEGGKYFGGTLKLNSVENYTTLFPATITDVYSQHITTQIFEGLLKYNQKTLEIEPCLAEDYEIDSSNKIYTFNLRKGVKYHDNDCFEDGKGREVKAADFKYVFEFLCSNHDLNKSQYFIQDYIKGGNEYASGKVESLEGVRVISDYQLQIELTEPFSGFTNILTLCQTGVFPKEAFDKYGNDIKENPVGCGPYQLESIGEHLILSKNESYWKKDEFGNQLPFISKIDISFEGNKSTELASFNNEELDFVWGVPVEEIPNIMGTLDEAMEGKNREFELQSVNSLQIQYFGFNSTHPAFTNVKVRQAFNYAINRDTIVNNILEGEGIIANGGIVPAMQGYPNENVKGYSYDPKLAKKLLAEAGYPNGKNFPEITLAFNTAGQVKELLAKTIQNQIYKNLGITINLVESNTQDINDNRENGKSHFWRYGWIADYPDPSNFLAQFHSKYIIEGEENSINYCRYSNPEFDKYLDLAMGEIDEDKRMNYYAQAEQILIQDAIVMPIYYASEIRLINPELKNFSINEIEFRDYSVAYFIDKKDKKKVRVYDNLGEAE